MKNILSVLRLSTILNGTPLIFWVDNEWVRCDFHDLFKNKISLINKMDYKDIIKHKSWKEYRGFVNNYSDIEYILINTWRLLILPDEIEKGFSKMLPSAKGNDIDFEYQRIPKDICRAYNEIISMLSPVDYVSDEVDNFARNFNSETISVSVRSWVETKGRKNLFDINEFYAAMDRHGKANFFISCDSPQVLDNLIERYGDRLIYYPKRSFMGDRTSSIGMQDILIDLYLLSKNSKIITSFVSTFSEMAWWLGGSRAEIEIVGIREEIRNDIRRRDRRKRMLLFLKNRFFKNMLVFKDQISKIKKQ